MRLKFSKYLTQITALLLLTFLAAPDAVGDEPQYKDYRSSSRQQEYFEISFDRRTISVTVFEGEKSSTRQFLRREIETGESSVSLSDEVRFEEDGLTFDGRQFPYRNISDVRVTDDEKLVVITFFTRDPAGSAAQRARRGNRLDFSGTMIIDEDEFVRGLVLSIRGDVEVYGEVNKDVISLFGDVYVGPGAVARGDVASISGRIDIARDASVYGEVYSGKKRRAVYRHRFRSREKTLSFSGTFHYNRVDGATPHGGMRFDDRDSVLPSFWALGGYAFESERWRYDFGLEQTIWRERPLAVGGSFYRRLASGDDWLLSDDENLVFTLLVTEDFKDYFEAEGGSAYVHFKPLPTITLETRYRFERTKWLDAQPHLWSILGGDKLFADNFGRVESAFRQQSIAEIDSTENACLISRVVFDTRDPDDLFAKSSWHLTGELEWSDSDLNSDFDYRRYRLAVSRYQKVHRRVMLLLRAMYGGSDGYLPMYKRYYLGGLGTLRGYQHKEFMGNRFWMANAEYRIDFPRTDLAAVVFWDGAQITDCTKLIKRDVEVKHCLGIGVFLGDDLRINLAKRLDRSSDDDPKVYVRFEHKF